jgi:hypothetical protein
MYPTLVSRRSALSTLLMPSASHSCARLIPGRFRTNASTLCPTVGMASNVYSLASPPSKRHPSAPPCGYQSAVRGLKISRSLITVAASGCEGLASPASHHSPRSQRPRAGSDRAPPSSSFSTCRNRVHASAPRILLATGSIPPLRRLFISGDRPTMAHQCQGGLDER